MPLTDEMIFRFMDALGDYIDARIEDRTGCWSSAERVRKTAAELEDRIKELLDGRT